MKSSDFRIGDLIGQKYEVVDVLGEGGFGFVYLVYVSPAHPFYALKTIRGEFLGQEQIRNRFLKEAQTWIDLGKHPYLVRSHWIDEISGRFFIGMDAIYPQYEGGPNSLDGYLSCSPLDLLQTLQWSIQFCHGMEYANLKGIRAHRDIKPSNIMIDQDKTVKISDFGLASFMGKKDAKIIINIDTPYRESGFSFQTAEGLCLGTPPYMPPEQFIDAAECDARSDIYSFGIVLYQMAANGALPFMVNTPMGDPNADPNHIWTEYFQLHSETRVPHLSSPLFPVIQKCLQKRQRKRYQTFQDLRKDLETIYKKLGAAVLLPPKEVMDSRDWNNKGISLNRFKRYEEAISCFDRAIQIDRLNASAWNNKGTSFRYLGKKREAMDCWQQALKINPENINALFNKAAALAESNDLDASIDCIAQIFKTGTIDPYLISQIAGLLGEFEYNPAQLRFVCQKIANINLRPHDKDGLYNLGLIFLQIEDIENALKLFLMAETIDRHDPGIWYELMNIFFKKQNAQKAIEYADKLLKDKESKYTEEAVNKKSRVLFYTGQTENGLSLLRSSLGENPNWDFLWFTLADLCEQAGYIKESISALNSCLAILRKAPAGDYQKIKKIESKLEKLKIQMQ